MEKQKVRIPFLRTKTKQNKITIIKQNELKATGSSDTKGAPRQTPHFRGRPVPRGARGRKANVRASTERREGTLLLPKNVRDDSETFAWAAPHAGRTRHSLTRTVPTAARRPRAGLATPGPRPCSGALGTGPVCRTGVLAQAPAASGARWALAEARPPLGSGQLATAVCAHMERRVHTWVTAETTVPTAA